MSVVKETRESSEVTSGVEGNAPLTASVAAVLLVLLAVEGVTLLEVGTLFRVHVFVGMLLVPPVLLKSASTGYRFFRYYTRSALYVRRGPPPLLLRVLGPAVVLLTFGVVTTGIVALWTPGSGRSVALVLHKASFVLWFAAMTVHVLGHLVGTLRLALSDWVRVDRVVAGAGLRRAALLASLVAGVGLGALALGQASVWLRHAA